MKHASGKSLFVDERNRLWIVSRERDRDGETAFALLRVSTDLVDAFRFKYEAVMAAEEVE